MKSPVEVVGLWQMFRETDFSWEVLVYDDVVVMLQLQFIVPEEGADGLHKGQSRKKGLKMHNFAFLFV